VPQASRCELTNNNQQLSSGCGERQAPIWSSAACPLRTGGTLPCWASSTGTSNDVLRMYGCTNVSFSGGTLGAALSRNVGAGPRNPRCLQLFPPSWRVADWYTVACTPLLALTARDDTSDRVAWQ
jgi:hypothetical protein